MRATSLGLVVLVALLLGAAPGPLHPGSSAATPAAALVFGDLDCGGAVGIGDAQKLARSLIGLVVTQGEGCPAIGGPADFGGAELLWGDVDCSGSLSIGDAQKLARNLIGLEVTQGAGCPLIRQPEVRIPAPPAPFPLPPGPADARALALAEAVGPVSPDPVAGWLAAYDALGIPVFGPDGSPLGTTGDDPMGPPFWRVWYMTVMASPQSSLSLTTLARGFNSEGDPAFDADGAAAALLADLRVAAISGDPQVQLFGLLTAAVVSGGPAGVDLLDPAVSAGEVLVPGDLAELLSWVAIRGLVFVVAEADAGSAGASLPLAAAGPPVGTPSQTCRNLFVREGADFWFNWVIRRLGFGFTLPGMASATLGIVRTLQEHVGVSGDLIAQTRLATQIVNVATGYLTLAMLVSALSVRDSMVPDPLVRTHLTDPAGYTAAITYHLYLDPGSLPDGNNLYACMASYMLNVFGVTFRFPVEADVPGAEIELFGQQGFPSCPPVPRRVRLHGQRAVRESRPECADDKQRRRGNVDCDGQVAEDRAL